MSANVIIIEDDLLVAAHVARGVTAHDGLSLVASARTLAGARTLLDRPVDLIILDLGLPDGSGIELIEEVRARGGLEPKILVLSVLGDQDTVPAGADGHLLKDIDSLDIGHLQRDLEQDAGPWAQNGPGSRTANEHGASWSSLVTSGVTRTSPRLPSPASGTFSRRIVAAARRSDARNASGQAMLDVAAEKISCRSSGFSRMHKSVAWPARKRLTPSRNMAIGLGRDQR